MKMIALPLAALGFIGAIPANADSSITYGSVTLLTARTCEAGAPVGECAPSVLHSMAESGGPSEVSSSTLSLPSGSSAYGAVSFGGLDLPTISAQAISTGSDRINSNNLGYQSYVYTGTSDIAFSLTATLHIDDASLPVTSVLPTDGNDAAGGGYTDYVAIWDPSVVAHISSANDILTSVFYADCSTPGVLGYASDGGFPTGGEQYTSITTQACSGGMDSTGPITLKPGQQVLAVAGLQLPVNQGGYVTALHTFDLALDPTLSADVRRELTANLLSSKAEGAVPEPSAWALMTGGIGFAGGVMRRRSRTSSKAVLA